MSAALCVPARRWPRRPRACWRSIAVTADVAHTGAHEGQACHRLRQAGLALALLLGPFEGPGNAGLSGAVPRVPIHHKGCFVGDAFSVDQQPIAEFGYPLLAEGIKIIDAAENIERSSLGKKKRLYFRPPINGVTCCRKDPLRWTQISYLPGFLAIQTEISLSRAIDWDASVCIGYSVSRSLTEVLYDHINVGVILGIHERHVDIVNMEISSQLPLGGTFGMAQGKIQNNESANTDEPQNPSRPDKLLIKFGNVSLDGKLL